MICHIAMSTVLYCNMVLSCLDGTHLLKNSAAAENGQFHSRCGSKLSSSPLPIQIAMLSKLRWVLWEACLKRERDIFVRILMKGV